MLPVSGSSLDLSICLIQSSVSNWRSRCLRLDPLMFQTYIIFGSLGEMARWQSLLPLLFFRVQSHKKHFHSSRSPSYRLCEIEDMSNSQMSNLSSCTSMTSKSWILALINGVLVLWSYSCVAILTQRVENRNIWITALSCQH